MAFPSDSTSSDLQLVLGFGSTDTTTTTPKKPSSNNLTAIICEPSLTLALSGHSNYLLPKKIDVNVKANCEETPLDHLSRQTSSPHSAVSSFSSGGGRVKRERDLSCSDEPEAERLSSRISDEDEDGSNARKKLRLTKEQSALLEESFKQHSTLNPQKQKQALARQLNLRPRQVEVWFQNRRARTKLKQTEVDCEFLKKCCETLTDENRRLQNELQELKALKLSQPLYVPMPAATLTMCPSCERLGGVGDGGGGSNKIPFSMTPKATHLYNPFNNPSAAC